MLEQGDLFWQDNLTHCLCQVWWRHTHLWMMILRKKKSYCKNTKNEWKGYHNKIVWLSLYWCRILTKVDVGQYFMTKRHWKILTIHRYSVACREYTWPRDEKSSDPKGWIRGRIPRLDPYWKSQPATHKVNMEWKLEIESMNKDNSHSWVRISHSEKWRNVLRPDEDTIRKIEARLKTLLVLHHVARINRSRGKKCGQSQWQKDYWNAVDVTSGANKNGHDTKSIRQQDDGKHRESQLAHGMDWGVLQIFGLPQDDWHGVHGHVYTKTQIRNYHYSGHEYKRPWLQTHF